MLYSPVVSQTFRNPFSQKRKKSNYILTLTELFIAIEKFAKENNDKLL